MVWAKPNEAGIAGLDLHSSLPLIGFATESQKTLREKTYLATIGLFGLIRV